MDVESEENRWVSLTTVTHRHLSTSGFDVLEARDLSAPRASLEKLSWHIELKESAFNLNSIDFRHTSWGRWITIHAQRCLEMLRLAPQVCFYIWCDAFDLAG